MKSQKIAGIRLINYIEDGITWKYHRDLVLDFWVYHKSRDYGYNPKMFEHMYYVSELPTDVQDVYEEWFESYDFNNTDKEWMQFVDGTLNLFYQTHEPTLVPDDTWFVMLMKSETKAREITETQIFRGNPNINSFWKINTTSKSEEVAGRRNGYLFTNLLSDISNRDTRGYYWAVAFQCPETVRLSYMDGDESKHKYINWAADCKNMTLLKITGSGRFRVVPVDIEGKAWRPDKTIPGKREVTTKNFTGHALVQYINRYYPDMYGKWEDLEAEIKAKREAINQRKTAMNTMNDEKVDVGTLVDVDDFIIDGNVTDYERKQNQLIRKRIAKRNRLREREIKKRMKEIEKNEGKRDRRSRNSLNPLISKK